MLIIVNTQTFSAKAPEAASPFPCPHSLVERLWGGNDIALAGRCAR